MVVLLQISADFGSCRSSMVREKLKKNGDYSEGEGNDSGEG